MDATTVLGWEIHFDELMQRIGNHFARGDLRLRARGYLKGLLSDVERKNSWQIAEQAGDKKPYGIQRLLGRARWDADELRDELIRYAREHLLGSGDSGVLIVDETGFIKRGDKSAGVQQQYCGAAGGIANCQIGVFVALASSQGRMLIDRELYLPQSWCENKPRRQRAGVPQERVFARKAKLAMNLLQRAFDAGIAPQWVLADEVYGNDGEFRYFLEHRHQPYVLAVASKQRVFLGEHYLKVSQIKEQIAPGKWFRVSIGQEASREYGFAALPSGPADPHGLQRWLLIRRHIVSGECAYYFCYAPTGTTQRQLAIASGSRWQIESCFECAKGETGLDQYEVRSFVGWYRHITLTMLACALLTAVRLAATKKSPARPTPRR